MCGDVTAFFSFAPKYTTQNPLLKRQLCPEFINVMIENNLSHKSGTNSMLCNVAMKGLPLLSHICIRTCPFFRRDVMSVCNFNVFIRIF